MSDIQFWQERLPDLIFVGGVKRSGKDFVCDRLVEQAGFTKCHLVEPWLRQWMAAHGEDPDRWEELKVKHRAQIQADAEAARAQDDQVLIRYMRDYLPTLAGPVCVTAVRFINEARLGIELGALVIRVQTDDKTREERFRASGDDLALMNDPFEREVPLMPVHLEMPGTMPADWYVPSITGLYHNLSELMFRNAVKGVEAVGGR